MPIGPCRLHEAVVGAPAVTSERVPVLVHAYVLGLAEVGVDLDSVLPLPLTAHLHVRVAADEPGEAEDANVVDRA